MDNEKFAEKVKSLRKNPDEYIKFIEENFGFKLLYYQKLFLKLLMNKKIKFL